MIKPVIVPFYKIELLLRDLQSRNVLIGPRLYMMYYYELSRRLAKFVKVTTLK